MQIKNLELDNKDILITGGAGFIGSNIAITIQNCFPSARVVIFDKYDNQEKLRNGNLVSFGTSNNINKFKGELINGDLTSSADIKSVLEKRYDYIFHQAAISDTTATDESLIYETNIKSFNYFLNYLQDRDTCLVYASSAATYGNCEIPQTVGIEDPNNLYAKSKLEMDNMTLNFIKTYPEKRLFGLRYFNVYGPNEFNKGKTASMVLQLALQILNNKEPVLFEGSNNYLRDFVYINDVVQANLICTNSRMSGIYNVGYGKSRSFQDISDILQKQLGTDLRNKYIDNPFKGSYQGNTLANIQDTVSKLKYKPIYSLEEGIADYLAEILKIHKSIGKNYV